VLRSDGPWKDEAIERSSGGVDIVIDPVGGDRFTDSLRALRPGWRVVVVGFTAGTIPEVRVNRLLLRNLEVVGAAWGEWTWNQLERGRQIGHAVSELCDQGVVCPIVGARFPFERATDALLALERREATGKVVLDVGTKSS
jgi:NADPH2:quinone reductase